MKMGEAWRSALWLIGILLSFLMVLIFVVVLHDGADTFQSYFHDIILKLFTPVAMSFLTVCLVGFLYDIIMKSHDRRDLNETILNAVRMAIFGREYGVDNSVNDHARLSNSQIAAKEKLIDLTKELHKDRLRQFDRDNILQINDFGDTWKILLHDTFANGEDMLDFSIASNAAFKYQSYQFSNYYSNLILERGQHRSSKSKVKIMLLCDEENNSEINVSKEFEGAVKRVLRRAYEINRHLDSNLSPGDVYKILATQSRGIYQVRLVNRHHFDGENHESDVFEIPFNVYGNLAISRSFVTPSRADTVAPIPHIEVSFKQDAISIYRDSFNRLWDAAASNIDEFSETMGDWNDIGQGNLLTTWARIGANK